MKGKLIGILKKVPVRAWIYVAVIAASFLAVALPLGLTGTEGAWYSVFWGAFSALGAFVIARVIYHSVTGDSSAEMWAISIYALIADLGWLIGILSTTYTVAVIGIVIMISGGMMSLGMRFIGKGGSKVEDAELLANACEILRYRFMGDVIEGVLDTKRPLVVVEGIADPLTVNEAIKDGYKDEAADAIAYLKKAIANSRMAKERK